jgi:hypothetical protein
MARKQVRDQVDWDDWDDWFPTPVAKRPSPLAINWAGQDILQKLRDDYKDAVITSPLKQMEGKMYYGERKVTKEYLDLMTAIEYPEPMDD